MMPVRHFLFIPALVNLGFVALFGNFAGAAIANSLQSGVWGPEILLHVGLAALFTCNAGLCFVFASGRK